MQFLGCEQREPIGEVKPHLIAEHTACACAGTVAFISTMFHHMAQQVKILFHFPIGFSIFCLIHPQALPPAPFTAALLAATPLMRCIIGMESRLRVAV